MEDTSKAQNLVENLGIVDKSSGTVNPDKMQQLTENITKTDTATGEKTLSAEDITDKSSAAAKMTVAVLTSSVANSSNNELKLDSVPLTSLNGISELLQEVATGSGTDTGELTLDLAGMKELKTVDNLNGVSVKEIKLEGNTSVTEIKLDGATVQNVDLKDSKVQELSLSSNSNVKEINASGAEELTDIDLAGNDNIQTLDVSGTNVSEIDASGCSNLTDLKMEGDSEGAGNLENINLDGCKNLKRLNIANNKVLGVRRPLGFDVPSDFEFKARGQKRTTEDTKFSMNFFEIITDLLKAVLSTADDTTGNDLPFDIGDIISIKVDGNEASVDNDGNLSAMPSKSLSYELDPFGRRRKLVDGGSINTADDEDEGMDVTIDSSSENGDGDGGAKGSGGGCSLSRNEEVGSRKYLLFALFLLGLVEFALLKFRR